MRGFHHSELPEVQGSVCIPTVDEAATIGSIVESLVGVVDQVVVVDGSSDDTPHIAAEAGAEVYAQSELLPEMGPVLGKGDAMWRALTVLTGDNVCFVDGDSEDFGPHFVRGLLGPLADPQIQYVKGHYRRPFRGEGEGGGRVTELTAKPLLRLFYPELAACRQPLAGEIAARRSLLEQLPWTTGYGVEIGQLIDVYRAVGIDAMAQVDLDVRQNRHQPLSALGSMATAVTATVAERLRREGRLDAPLPAVVERPPLRSLRAAA
ncbi:MAG: glucosyl-3-phosphoglycerate synthase [Thermoleophilaceae bacterium]|nr:glucosyl-3-phosphoglycerate synthase [Thermoleophilaceae bacterium]